MKKWKSFDFGPESPPNKKSPIEKKPNKNNSEDLYKSTKSNGTDNKIQLFNFFKLIAPKNVSELAVQPKKIQEIESWLQFHAIDSVNNPQKISTPFLLITGPTGSAKTTTVKLLCKTLGISVREWSNPVDIDYELVQGPNQLDRFLEFMVESKYNSLFESASCNKLVIVKDFPNVIIKKPEEFFNKVLEESYFKNMQPIIFICTDSSSKDTNLTRTLFPDEIQLKYSFTHYSFNPCATSLLKSALKRAQSLTQQKPNMFRNPSASNIEAIVVSCMGDIRSAMNQFYLASLIGGGDLPTMSVANDKPSGKRKRNEKNGSSTLKSMNRDESLGIFHGLGRVLNPKRIDHKNSWRLNCDVSKIVDEFSSQPSNFISFLTENYLKYFGNINDIDIAADILSISSQLVKKWENHECLILSLWIAVFGLMVANEHRVSKWNQIRGPRKINNSTVKRDVGYKSTDMFYIDMINKSEKSHRFKLV